MSASTGISERQQVLHGLLPSVLIAGVLVVYVLVALTEGKSFRGATHPVGFYGVAAEAILDGKLAVLETPERLTTRPDPYDPSQNYKSRHAGYHDYAYYDGKIYSPFGPTPTLLSHVPYRLLGLGYLNPLLASLIWSGGAMIAALGAWRELSRRFLTVRPRWLDPAAVLALGLAGPLPWLVSVGRAYEEAIACGAFLLMVGTWCLLRGLRDAAQPSLMLLATAGTTFGLAVGARPHLLLAVVFLAVAVVAVWRAATRRRAIVALAATFVPYVLIGIGIAAFNMARFDSPFEFGRTWQLAGMHMPTYPLNRLAHLGPNLADYLASCPRLTTTWPFVDLIPRTFGNDPTVHGHEPIAGMLTTFPVVALGLRCVPTAIRRLRQSAFTVTVASAAVVSTLVLIGASLPFNSSTMRYTADFVPLMALLALLAFGVAASTSPTRRGHRILVGTWGVALALSTAAGVLLALPPCSGS